MLASQFLTSVKWLIFIRLIFGHYYDVGKSKLLNFLIRSYCFLFAAFCCALFFKFTEITFVALVSYYYTEFIFNCLISLLFKSNYVNEILSLVSITGKILNAEYIEVSYKTCGSLLMLLFIRVVVYVYFGRALGYDVLLILLCFILLSSIFVSYISKILFFDALFHRMRTIRKSFEYKYVEINVIGMERVKHRIKNIMTCLTAYDNLLQHVENMDLGLEIWGYWECIAGYINSFCYFYRILAFDVVFNRMKLIRQTLELFFTVLIYFPKAVIFMRNAMMLILNKELFTFKTFWTVITLILTICVGTWPMILFELTKNEVDIIKDILFKQSLMDTDETLRLETQRALQHISLRPCQYHVCRMMPMGVGLSLSFISLCITYVIVLVQLTPVK